MNEREKKNSRKSEKKDTHCHSTHSLGINSQMLNKQQKMSTLMCVFLSDVQQIAIKRSSSELAHEYCVCVSVCSLLGENLIFFFFILQIQKVFLFKFSSPFYN